MDYMQQQPEFNTFIQSLMAPSTTADNPIATAPPGPFGVPVQQPTAPTAIASAMAPQPQASPAPVAQMNPMVDQATLQQKISAALGGNVGPTEQDKSQAIMRMALAMMAAPKPGQNLASQFSEAATGTLSQLDAATQRNRTQTMQQAGLAMEVSKFQNESYKTAMDIKEAETKLQYLPEKERADIALKVQQAKTSMMQGKADEASAKLHEAQAMYAPQLTQAEIKQREALASEARARAGAATSEAKWRDAQVGNEKVKVNISKLSDNSALVIEQNREGVQKQYIIGSRDAEAVDMQVAKALRDKQITKEQEDSYRVQLMQPYKMDIPSGQQVAPAKAPVTSTPGVIDAATIRKSLTPPASTGTAQPTVATTAPAKTFDPAAELASIEARLAAGSQPFSMSTPLKDQTFLGVAERKDLELRAKALREQLAGAK